MLRVNHEVRETPGQRIRHPEYSTFHREVSVPHGYSPTRVHEHHTERGNAAGTAQLNGNQCIARVAERGDGAEIVAEEGRESFAGSGRHRAPPPSTERGGIRAQRGMATCTAYHVVGKGPAAAQCALTKLAGERRVQLGSELGPIGRGAPARGVRAPVLHRRNRHALGRELRDDDIEGVTRGAIAHAATIDGAGYLSAIGRIHRYGRQMAAFFEDWDMLLTPTLAEPPALIGRFNHDTEDYLDFRLGPDRCFDYSPYAAAFNATGQPAMSVPLAWSDRGLPIGIHLAGRFGADETLIALAADLERTRPWVNRRPGALPTRGA